MNDSQLTAIGINFNDDGVKCGDVLRVDSFRIAIITEVSPHSLKYRTATKIEFINFWGKRIYNNVKKTTLKRISNINQRYLRT